MSDSPSTRLATRLSFLVAGFGVACWGPLVPFAKLRLAVDEGVLGALLLCLGAGSVLAMLVTGALSSRFGTRPVILLGGFGLCAVLPLLAILPTALTLGAGLLVFGASLGSLDVAMNIHAVEVEKGAGRPLMSGFHALFSIGGFAGSLMMALLLSLGASALLGALLGALLMALALAYAAPRLMRTRTAENRPEDGPHFALPRGIVLVLAGLTAITFLAEGALLDWGALFLTEAGLVDVKLGGFGYMFFAMAMTLGRLTGDALTARIGDRAALLWGGALAVAGFGVLIAAPVAWVAWAGFVLIGLGAANIVPVLFRQAASQTQMAAAQAIAAISTTGYAGVLLGPAAIGLVAEYAGLKMSFAMLAGLICLVPLCSAFVVRSGRPA
ncbi:MFS transporter [Novosphingobium sp. KACC 22771]|uniref:MFS transporter n=1 Tax=Novosphingobium sp. KACC 22771 TaxID=3025670 RepID=UPI002365A7B0|nr:MFS transporter [Novosphingobium sp. KACC 22771]WDF72370.1 MFS transporter [Novosphingobium sp. KACC 22771]